MTECRYTKYADHLTPLVKIAMGNSCPRCHKSLPKCVIFIEPSFLLIPIWLNKHVSEKTSKSVYL